MSWCSISTPPVYSTRWLCFVVASTTWLLLFSCSTRLLFCSFVCLTTVGKGMSVCVAFGVVFTPGMHAPPRPAPAPGEMAAPGRPGPENFQLCPAPPRKKRALPRPAPPRKLPRGKNRGKRSYIIKSFWESKTFDQYF